jgi:hypothetical protein
MVINTKKLTYCTCCGAWKKRSLFYKCTLRNNRTTGICKECKSFNSHLNYLKNKEQIRAVAYKWVRKNKKRHYKNCAKWIKKNKWYAIHSFHKDAAKRRGLKNELTPADVKQLFTAETKLCSVTGKRLKHNRGKAKSDSPCLCRNHFSEDYTKENVSLVAHGEVMKKAAEYNQGFTKHDRAIDRIRAWRKRLKGVK